jgi:hypothetical protein
MGRIDIRDGSGQSSTDPRTDLDRKIIAVYTYRGGHPWREGADG